MKEMKLSKAEIAERRKERRKELRKWGEMDSLGVVRIERGAGIGIQLNDDDESELMARLEAEDLRTIKEFERLEKEIDLLHAKAKKNSPELLKRATLMGISKSFKKYYHKMYEKALKGKINQPFLYIDTLPKGITGHNLGEVVGIFIGSIDRIIYLSLMIKEINLDTKKEAPIIAMAKSIKNSMDELEYKPSEEVIMKHMLNIENKYPSITKEIQALLTTIANIFLT